MRVRILIFTYKQAYSWRKIAVQCSTSVVITEHCYKSVLQKLQKCTFSPWNILATIFHEFDPSSISVQFNSVAQSCLTLCNPMNRSTAGLPVHHQLLESTQTHVHWVGDATQPSHLLLSPSPPAFILSQHQGLFQWVSSSHQVAK